MRTISGLGVGVGVGVGEPVNLGERFFRAA